MPSGGSSRSTTAGGIWAARRWKNCGWTCGRCCPSGETGGTATHRRRMRKPRRDECETAYRPFLSGSFRVRYYVRRCKRNNGSAMQSGMSEIPAELRASLEDRVREQIVSEVRGDVAAL